MLTVSTSADEVLGAGEAGFRAALTGVCVVRLETTGWIRVTGDDRVRWLNGMVTNSIQGLKTGEGCTNFLLNAQGRIQGTAFAFAAAEAIWLETDQAQVEPMMAMLDRYIIMDDVELADRTGERAGLLVMGPGAATAIDDVGLALPGGEGALQTAEMAWHGGTVRVQRMPGKVVTRVEVWGGAETIADVMAALTAAGAVAGDAETVETLRLMEGTPRFGADIRERELPQETGQVEALHFNKGCYLGQEIVERIRSRGAVNRVFRGFLLEGTMPAVGASLLAGEKVVGELTSVGRIPAVEGATEARQVGLGYVRREAVDVRQELGYEGGVAQVSELPMALAAAGDVLKPAGAEAR